MKYTLNNTTIELSNEDIYNICKQFQSEQKPTHKRKYFVPKVGDTYWLIETDGKITPRIWEYDMYDKRFLKSGNCFATEQDAQDELNRRQSLVRIWNNYDDKYSWDIDWEDNNQDKHMIAYSKKHDAFDYGTCKTRVYKYNTELPYFKSAEDRNQFIESNMEDLLKIFNIKK